MSCPLGCSCGFLCFLVWVPPWWRLAPLCWLCVVLVVIWCLYVWWCGVSSYRLVGCASRSGLMGWWRRWDYGISVLPRSLGWLGVCVFSFFSGFVFFVCIELGRAGRFRFLRWLTLAAMLVASVLRRWVYLFGAWLGGCVLVGILHLCTRWFVLVWVSRGSIVWQCMWFGCLSVCGLVFPWHHMV